MSFRGGRGAPRGGGRGGGRGGFSNFSSGPPDRVEGRMPLAESFSYLSVVGTFLHPCQADIVCASANDQVPYFNAPIYLENKTQVGKVDDIFGPINERVCFVLS